MKSSASSSTAIAHLLGHDHEEASERRRMVREEKRLARAIGLTWPYGQ